MPKKVPKRYTLLDGRQVNLRTLDPREQAFIANLEKMVRQAIDYFEICRAAVGPGSVALGGNNHVDRRTVDRPVYLVAVDLATRAGMRQGLVLAPEHEDKRSAAPRDGSMISVTQAADLIGISRAAVYKAIEKGNLRALRIGNVTVVHRGAAAEYKRRRTADAPNRKYRSAGRPNQRVALVARH